MPRPPAHLSRITSGDSLRRRAGLGSYGCVHNLRPYLDLQASLRNPSAPGLLPCQTHTKAKANLGFGWTISCYLTAGPAAWPSGAA